MAPPRSAYLRVAFLTLALAWGAYATAASPDRLRPAYAAAKPLAGPPSPPYLLLEQSRSGVGLTTVGRPYAYGWFGVAPRRHTIVHKGYYGGHWLSPSRIAP